MTSEEALYLLMTNQKKVRDDFTFINLNTHEKVSIEECYNIVIKDLEVLEILKKKMIIDTDYYDSDDGCEEFEYIAYNGQPLNIENKQEYDLLKEWLENEKD